MINLAKTPLTVGGKQSGLSSDRSVACLRHAVPPAHRPPHTASVGLLRFRACGTGGIRNGQPSRRIMSILIFCSTSLLVSKTRYFSNPTRNERSECRVGYADDARVQACRRHATIICAHLLSFFMFLECKNSNYFHIPKNYF